MNNSKKNIIIGTSIAALIGIMAFILQKNQKEVQSKIYHKDKDLRAVIQAYTTKEAAFSQSTLFIGSFSPSREITISSEASGKVVKVGVEEGDAVETGDLIAQLDAEMLQAQMLSIQANYDNAEKLLTRYTQAQSGISQIQLDNAQTQYLMAKAQYAQLKKQISQTTITAPFSGVVTSRNFDLGAVTSPGVPMAILIDISKLKFEISVPEKNVIQFKKGSVISVTADIYPNSVFKGVINYVSSKADMSRNYTIKIVIPNNPQFPLKAGMYGRVIQNIFSPSMGIAIPRSAIIGSTINPQVYVVENGVAHLRDVQLGSGNESSVMVVGGLKKNEIVAVGGLVNLSDSCKVAIAN